jgi:tripartite-type tricarboxylate transporter receptor subunit TctC
VPTISESGLPKFEAPGWFALAGPAGLPETVLAPLRRAIGEMRATPEFATRLEALGQTVAPAQQDVRTVLANELATWKKLFADRKIVVDS